MRTHPTDPPKLKVVQLVEGERDLLAVGDDGSIWGRSIGGEWEEMTVPRRTE